jgi:hypothetical protein
MSTARILFAAAGAFAVTLVGHAASADAPSIRSIPIGKLPGPQTTSGAPTSIPAGEKIDGLFVVRPPASKLAVGSTASYTYKTALITSSEAVARDIAAGKGAYGQPGEVRRVCLSLNNSTSSQSVATMSVYVPKATAGKGGKSSAVSTYRPRNVQLLRAERMGDDGNLEITDAWVDVDTLGVRQISKSSVALAKVGTGPGGVLVYSAKTEKSVDFIVKQPPVDRTLPSHIVNIPSRLTAQTPTGFNSTGDCGHMRVSLQVEPGGGQMASVFGTAILPPAPGDDDHDDDHDDDDGDRDEELTKLMRNEKGRRDVRTRPFVANLSVSQTKSVKEPIVSVSFGWSGKDQHAKF